MALLKNRGIVPLSLIVVATLFVAIGAVGWITTVGKKAADDRISVGGESHESDTDGDGLSNWEEELWGTDINNPDTDGDGTSDGDEIAQNRNPHIPAPNDTLAETKLSFDSGSTTTTPTDLLARDILLGTLLLNQSGNRSPEERQRLLEEAFADRLSELPAPQQASADDLTVVSDNGANARQYHDALVEVLTTYTPEDRRKELLGIYEVVEEGVVSQDLSGISRAHGERAQRLIDTPVPQTAAPFHLAIVNYFYQLSQSVTMFSQDPAPDIMFLLAAAHTYQELVEGELSIHESITNYFSDYGITFAQSREEVLFK